VSTPNDEQLASALVALGVIGEMELEEAREIQSAEGKNLVQALLSSGMVSAHDIARATEAMADSAEEAAAPPIREGLTGIVRD